VLIFAAVGHNYKSELIMLPSKREVDGELRVFRLDAQSYVRRCLQKIAPSLKNKIFQQDGARSHVAKSTLAYLKKKQIEVLPNWPGYSPDLSPIEYVWKDLQSGIGQHCPLTLEELMSTAKKVWKELDQGVINAHVAHFSSMIREMK